ncbi:SusD/RagB family nutrient-binding outer membrane lipoprotein [Flavobacterium gilvum]|uniref:SusD/RagB family nutrient-binding outer membrane lipoprotein n=1 Tax=Flavobacterium gilvum TaxID=1492737 RepID=A0AAC9N754_9FLAO|nr:SusD/RagB family nutrient-binding outer membrane lipoprotein [Flavobacterium gilvum]AOW11172.1 hypothetical protein EM308_17720 [Flavobacterium gilvum]KFC60052.1 hypothetical protein FEM08_11630 [Flavobacterium gilvum]
MKKTIKKTIVFLVITSLFVSCTKDFEELNTDKTKLVGLDVASLEYSFSAAENRGIYSYAGQYQLGPGLFSDLQAQYFATTQKNFASDRNVMVANWLNAAWNFFYAAASPQMDVVLEYTKPGGKLQDPMKYAIAKIYRVSMYLPITDNWGAIPYFQAGNGKKEVLYDSQEDIYKDFLKTLKEATAVLSAYNGTGKFFEKGDIIYGGSPAKWLKFGNSMRLRVAMRISKKDPALAKAEAEAAVAAPGGLLISNADNANVSVSPIYTNPLGGYANLGEFRMSSSMESVLKGFNDPRLPKFFAPALNGGAYKGVRNGMTVTQMADPTNSINVTSGINATNVSNSVTAAKDNEGKTPWTIFTAAETYFLLAEGALNGWNMGGTAASFYNAGITASLNQWSITGAEVTTYLAGTSTPIALNDSYNTPAMTDIPVAFAATPDKQREQIGTQKWLAIFPYSSEAWSEVRRTGFPKLYPRLNSDNLDSPASDPLSIRRLPYPAIEAAVNAGGLASGISKLGGPDKSSTKLWWNP